LLQTVDPVLKVCLLKRLDRMGVFLNSQTGADTLSLWHEPTPRRSTATAVCAAAIRGTAQGSYFHGVVCAAALAAVGLA
jgi:hypothetical protein